MKILYYNWNPFNEKEGGGIGVYQRNLTKYLSDNVDDIEEVFLNSGFYYDSSKEIHLRHDANTDESLNNVSFYSIVNSPVVAPMRSDINNFRTYLEDRSLLEFFREFVNLHGAFDVIHFQSLEGLSLSVLELKKEFPNTKFIYSVHNYTLFCPNVTFWKTNNSNCAFCDNQECGKCMRKYQLPKTKTSKYFRKFAEGDSTVDKKLYLATRIITHGLRDYKIASFYASNATYRKYADRIFQQYKEKNVAYINKYVDHVLAVSERVREISEKHGVLPEILHTNYIGTKVADEQIHHSVADIQDDIFHIIYIGYMTKEKGFYFLLDSLEKLAPEIKEKISVTFAAKLTDYSVLKRFKKMRKEFHEVILINGYQHDELPQILSNKQLGIVPVLWEDNLPQVAIEMVAGGVPILASSCGGPSELSGEESCCFEAGNEKDFLDKLLAIMDNRELIQKYWEKNMVLKDMRQHWEELMEYYKG